MAGSSRVLVLGGGPAGAVSAAMLARQGVKVTLVDKARFPRFHVGESLQPAAFDYLERGLGIREVFAKQGFARKYGAVYVWGESRDPWQVLFDARLEADLPGLTEADMLAGPYEHAWNVDRAKFDAILLDEARSSGVDVQEGVTVLAPRFDGSRCVGARVKLASGQEVDLSADVVLDCSGQSCLIGRTLGLTRVVSDLRSTATHAYFAGAGGLPGPLGRHVQYVVTIPEGWVWFIPTSPDVTSVGVVVRERSKLTPARFQALIDAAELPLAGAERLPGPHEGNLHYHRDWSFTHPQMAGPGWMMVGDAACFVDPILSGGVDFAIRGAFKATHAVMACLSGADPEAEAARYTAEVSREYRAYLRLARYWYGNNRSVDGFFWQAHQEVAEVHRYTPMRAFVYLTSGKYARDRDFKVFDEAQEREIFRRLGVDAASLGRGAR